MVIKTGSPDPLKLGMVSIPLMKSLTYTVLSYDMRHTCWRPWRSYSMWWRLWIELLLVLLVLGLVVPELEAGLLFSNFVPSLLLICRSWVSP